jgi:hypothetical protein
VDIIAATAARFAAYKAQAAAMTDEQLTETVGDHRAPYLLRQYAVDAQITRGKQNIHAH